MKKNTTLLIIITLLSGCLASNNVTEQYQTKILESLIDSKHFEIECDWARPQMTVAMSQIQNSGLLPIGSSMSNINISSNSNYLRMKADTITAYLPYYGEQRFGGSYNSTEIGVVFDGVPKDFTISKGKKGSYFITFNIRDKNKTSENYTVYIQLFRNLSSTIRINSSHRTTIEYSGYVKDLVHVDKSS